MLSSYKSITLTVTAFASFAAARSITDMSPEGTVQGQTYTTKYIGMGMNGTSHKSISLESLSQDTVDARRTRCANECFAEPWCRAFENLEDTFVCNLSGEHCPGQLPSDKLVINGEAFVSCPDFERTELINREIQDQDDDAVVKAYYGDTLMSAAVVAGYTHIHSDSVPVVLWKIDHRALPHTVAALSGEAGAKLYTTSNEYANACGDACNAEENCIAFAFAFLPETDPNATECVWADDTTLYAATGYKETWDMRYGLYQMMVTADGAAACPEGQFLGYNEGGEVTYDVTNFGCNSQFNVNEVCAPEQTIVYDLSFENTGCGAGLKCDYHPLDPNQYVGVCWNDTTLATDKATRADLLLEYDDMISNITVEGYGYVRSPERIDGLSRGLMAFSDNYTLTKTVPELKGSAIYPTVNEYVLACTAACDADCWGVAFVYKENAVENECRLLPNNVRFSMEYAQQYIKTNGTIVPVGTVLYAVYAKNNEKACTFDAFPGYSSNWKGMDNVGCHPVVRENERCVTVDVDLRANSTDGCDTGLECQDTSNYERCLPLEYDQSTTPIAFESMYLDGNVQVGVVTANKAFSSQAPVLATVDLSSSQDKTMQERWNLCAGECQSLATCVSFANDDISFTCVLSNVDVTGCAYVPQLDSCNELTVLSNSSYLSQIERS